jgi:hypothetical protein
MKSEIRKVAEAAIAAPPRTSRFELEGHIMMTCGSGALAVRTLLASLVREGFLNFCVSGAGTLAAGNWPDRGSDLIWYERGDRWDKLPP